MNRRSQRKLKKEPSPESEHSSTTRTTNKPKRKRRRASNATKEGILGKGTLRTYKIPKHKLDNALRILNERPSKKDRSEIKDCCFSKIHEIDYGQWEKLRQRPTKLLMKAKSCFLRKDWNGLARILCHAKLYCGHYFNTHFPVIKMYALICLAHRPDRELLLQFKNGVLGQKRSFATYQEKFYKIWGKICP